jgi:hypothetical protein
MEKNQKIRIRDGKKVGFRINNPDLGSATLIVIETNIAASFNEMHGYSIMNS